MKKISMILLAVALPLFFAACKADKKAEEAAQAPAAEVVETPPAEEAAPVVEPTPAEALKAFQAYAREYGEAFNNLTKDPQKFQKMAGELQQRVADMERVKIDLTSAQLKNYEKALKIITDVNSGGTKR
jgi:hypothetical protein